MDNLKKNDKTNNLTVYFLYSLVMKACLKIIYWDNY
jgi:hypothetical protein